MGVINCKRCGRFCPPRPEGYCFHCFVGIGIGFIDPETHKMAETTEDIHRLSTRQLELLEQREEG